MVTLKDEISSQKIFSVTWPNFIPKKITDLLLFATIYSNRNFLLLHLRFLISSNNYLLRIDNRNTRKRCEICSKLTIKTPEWRQLTCCSIVFVVNSEHISHIFLLFLLLTLNKQLFAVKALKIARNRNISFVVPPENVLRYSKTVIFYLNVGNR